MAASAAMQEYLAEAYRIAYYHGGDAYISTTALADVLKVSAPAVTRMVQRLKEAGYLEHEPYRGIRLTTEGEREALSNIRSHRLVERFLVDVMGLGWHEVHDAADELGAVVSDTLVRRMADMTGHPRRCPHGEPIPDENGYMPRVIDYRLNDLNPGGMYVISRVNTHDAEMLRYFDELGIKPGISFELVSRAPFNGPLQIRLNNQIIHLGHELSGVLRVCTQAEFDLV